MENEPSLGQCKRTWAKQHVNLKHTGALELVQNCFMLAFFPSNDLDNRYLDVSAPADIIAVPSRGNQHESMDNY